MTRTRTPLAKRAADRSHSRATPAHKLRVESLEARDVPSAAVDPVTGIGHAPGGQKYVALLGRPSTTVDPAEWDTGTQVSTQVLTTGQVFSMHSRPSAHHAIPTSRAPSPTDTAR